MLKLLMQRTPSMFEFHALVISNSFIFLCVVSVGSRSAVSFSSIPATPVMKRQESKEKESSGPVSSGGILPTVNSSLTGKNHKAAFKLVSSCAQGLHSPFSAHRLIITTPVCFFALWYILLFAGWLWSSRKTWEISYILGKYGTIFAAH